MPAAAHLPAIYYVCTLPARAGGEVINFQHVATLRAMGLRAFALLDRAARVAVPSRPYAVPLVTWGPHLQLRADDWLVIPEVAGIANVQQLRQLPCRTVVHNQNPYYSFRGFPDMAAMNAHGLAGGITYGHVTLATLRRWGSTIDWQVVQPAVLPIFRSDRPKRRQIAYMPRKRAGEADIVRQLLHGIHPDLAGVPWVEINDMSRPQVAELLAQSLVFASLSRLEGLGLPPLEAMAAGCLVCGYDGFGGREFARPDNGFWVPDGDAEAFAEAIATALRLDAPTAATYVAAGRAMAASFSQERFHDELAAAWHHLLGDRWADYQVATA